MHEMELFRLIILSWKRARRHSVVQVFNNAINCDGEIWKIWRCSFGLPSFFNFFPKLGFDVRISLLLWNKANNGSVM